METFRSSYGALPGYPLADAYLECILSLATSGVESERVKEVLEGGVYDESYRRFISVIESVGAVFEDVPDSDPTQRKIAAKLIDQDVCLSMMDKISIKKEKLAKEAGIAEEGGAAAEEVESEVAASKEEEAEPVEDEAPVAEVAPEEEKRPELASNEKEQKEVKKKSKKRRFFSWFMDEKEEEEAEPSVDEPAANVTADNDETEEKEQEEEIESLKPEDLGAVLLSAEEPSMTRQLNVLSNIVQRALLFGGDQELLVLSETLEADQPAFVQRWYPETSANAESETRPGVQYFNCLVQLLKKCYKTGIVTNLEPHSPLTPSYANAYERLIASLVELGSGYVRPVGQSAAGKVLPKTPQEELGRFAQWESTFRKNRPDTGAYPEDLVGNYEVKDEIGGETIGVTTVSFLPEGDVEVAPPLRGLRWRLDPGPTHLDTCTFQVLGDDGAILQYRGFVDRGARLEARFSRRAIKIRGAVTFQMRDPGEAQMGEDYRRDLLPVGYRTGKTRFVMTKSAEERKE